MLLLSGLFSQSLALALKADLIEAVMTQREPVQSQELARLSELPVALVTRVARVLVVAEILEEVDEGRFREGRLARFLRRDAPLDFRWFAELVTSEEYWQTWGCLGTAPKSLPLFKAPSGGSFTNETCSGSDFGLKFRRWMQASTRAASLAILSAFDFGWYNTIVDVGGGDGGLGEQIARRYPKIRYVVADCWVAGETGTLENLSFQRCDMFVSVPGGGDLYLLKNVLHDWGDEECVQILQNIQSVMNSEASILIVERILAKLSCSRTDALLDLNKVLFQRGAERSLESFLDLLKAADLRLVKVHSTRSRLSLIEARL